MSPSDVHSLKISIRPFEILFVTINIESAHTNLVKTALKISMHYWISAMGFLSNVESSDFCVL
jgi:hypothetical protein